MSGNDTKQKILEVSLNLFSQRGYSAVSIRDICKLIGIKESSIYYHFKNKNSILEELQNKFELNVSGLMKQLNSAVSSPWNTKVFSPENITKPFFQDYLMDDFCNKFMRLLYIEQNNNEEIRKVYEKWLFDEPIKFQSRIFSILIDQKIIDFRDDEYLAVKFYSPVFLYFQRYLLSGNLTEDKKEQFLQKANYHILCFFKEIGGI